MIPVDEMLNDLRDRLEAFALAPTHEAFDAIQNETRRIEHCCEGVLHHDDGDGDDYEDA